MADSLSRQKYGEKTNGRAIYLYVEGWMLYTWSPFVAVKCNFMYIYVRIYIHKKALGVWVTLSSRKRWAETFNVLVCG